MIADELAAHIDAAVGRERWFVSHEVPQWDPKPAVTLLYHGRLLRKRLNRDDAVWSVVPQWEYLLREAA